jgi:hypothetical protein
MVLSTAAQKWFLFIHGAGDVAKLRFVQQLIAVARVKTLQHDRQMA